MNKILFFLCLIISSLSNAYLNESLVIAIEESNWTAVDAELAKTASWTQEAKDYFINLAHIKVQQRREELTIRLNTFDITRNLLELTALYIAGGAGYTLCYLHTNLQQNKISSAKYLASCAALGLVAGYAAGYFNKTASLRTNMLSVHHLNAIYILEKLVNSNHIELITSSSLEIAS